MPKLEITESAIRAKCVAPGNDSVTKAGRVKADEFYWDTRTEGFGVRVKGDGSKHFVVQRKLPGKGASVRGTLGRWGDVTLTEARDKAVAAIAKIREGVNPFEVARQTAQAANPKWGTLTLAQAFD